MKKFVFLAAFFSVFYASAEYKSPPIKLCHFETYESCFQAHVSDLASPDFRYPSRSFVMYQASPTGKAAVLVHGLTDSPFIMKDVASILFKQGYDVFAVLLIGHGTQAEDLFTVKKEQWQMQINQAARMMAPRASNGKILLAGFSMGGALVTSEVLRHPGRYSALVQISPALSLADWKAPASCLARAFFDWASVSEERENSPWRYNRMPLNAVCELTRVVSEISGRGAEIEIPMWSAVSTGDKRIDVSQVVSYLRTGKNPNNAAIVISNPSIGHADLPLKVNPFVQRTNPEFPRLETGLNEFLNKISH